MPHTSSTTVTVNGNGHHVGPQVHANILSTIGHTPLIKLNRIPQSEGIDCQVYVKCEFLNPGGSHKDRIALRMIQDAENKGLIKPGISTIIEPTSGNTGVGVAMVCAVKGYKCILVMPDKMSSEKMSTMYSLGAQIIRTPNSFKGHIAVAQKLNQEIPNSYILDQYANEGNANAHYDETAEEILEQCGGHLDMIIIGVGTGGAISGIGRKMKEKCSECVVIGVDPEGSIMAEPAAINEPTKGKFFEVEGIGHDWIPNALDSTVVDKWYKSSDSQTFQMARRIISEEGMLIGGSCGAMLSSGLDAIRDANLPKSAKCVILFPDSIRNYMTKFPVDSWMMERGFLPKKSHQMEQIYSNWWTKSLNETKIIKNPEILSPDMPISKGMTLLEDLDLSTIPVLDKSGTIKGVFTSKNLFAQMTQKNFNSPGLTVGDTLTRQFKKVPSNVPLGVLTQSFQEFDIALVIDTSIKTDSQGVETKCEKLIGTVSQSDLLKYLTNCENFGISKTSNGIEKPAEIA